jgi:hypothetical protein
MLTLLCFSLLSLVLKRTSTLHYNMSAPFTPIWEVRFVLLTPSRWQWMYAIGPGTDILKPLKMILQIPPVKNVPRNVFLLTDGEVCFIQFSDETLRKFRWTFFVGAQHIGDYFFCKVTLCHYESVLLWHWGECFSYTCTRCCQVTISTCTICEADFFFFEQSGKGLCGIRVF